MVVNDNAMYLSAEQQHFKAKDGREVTFYKLYFIPESDNKPISMTCTEEVYNMSKTLAPRENVLVGVEIYENRGYVKTRATYLGAAVNTNDQIDY